MIKVKGRENLNFPAFYVGKSTTFHQVRINKTFPLNSKCRRVGVGLGVYRRKNDRTKTAVEFDQVKSAVCLHFVPWSFFVYDSDDKVDATEHKQDLVVIREIYDSDNAQEIFEMELERAIQVRKKHLLN